ncbi:MAG: HPr kinase/phosphorylase [Caulobacteraceae bacterium]|nr:HPr kinase/phosphorylase [Caulobacteraceae bacterium]
MILHAGLIARLEPSGWRGVLIEGPSGSGKSDLALRAIDAGWSLVADDRTLVWASGGRAYGRAAPALDGLIEARGVGVLGERSRSFAPIYLVVCCTDASKVERMPEFQARTLVGVSVPRIELAPREGSSVAKLARALCHLGLRPHPAYQACRAGSPRPATGGDP